MQFQQTQLANGLNIIGEVNPSAVSLAVGFFARTGSRDETPEVAGVSHFLEHMMFKGTARRSPFDISREFDEMGALYNAFTSEENTVYYAAVLPEFQSPVLDLLGDMLRPALREDDFETEKQVILEEIALYDDMPRYRLHEKLMAEHFGDHPLAKSVLGTRESIAALRREDMLGYFDRRYSPSNLTLVGVGNLDWDPFVTKAKQTCEQWDRYDVGREAISTEGTGRQNVIPDTKLKQQHIGLMSPAPSAQDASRYAARVLATILGDSTGSRLFYALVEPGIAEEASCSYEEFDGAGSFVTFISAEPDKAPKALAITRAEFGKFVTEGPTEKEMSAAKNKIASAATLKGELPMGRLTSVGYEWIYRAGYVTLAEHIKRTLSVTTEEVRELVRRYDLTKTTTLALGPNESLDP